VDHFQAPQKSGGKAPDVRHIQAFARIVRLLQQPVERSPLTKLHDDEKVTRVLPSPVVANQVWVLGEQCNTLKLPDVDRLILGPAVLVFGLFKGKQRASSVQ
jgi:hypothetical protein